MYYLQRSVLKAKRIDLSSFIFSPFLQQFFALAVCGLKRGDERRERKKIRNCSLTHSSFPPFAFIFSLSPLLSTVAWAA